MAYHLLTGATGLIGRYLLYHFTKAGIPVAVLVRPGKFNTARDRIEAVMHYWESYAHRSLPRPVVLQGELIQPDLGLSAEQQNWVSRNCDTIVHSAAAMVFRADENGEPFRTNVQGMRNILDICSRCGIRRFHHVSTAYICGLRQGRIFEHEIDLGQTFGNVYEESKIEAEKLLHAADCIDQLTVYRPASVIGDSQTGYTTNFHGFYLPLQLAYSFATAIPPEEMNERFIKRLGLGGDEGKNFVPVDWVSSAIAHVVLHPELHGRTYHLAAPKGVSVRLFQSVVQEAIRRFCKRPVAAKVNSQELDVYEKLFHDQLLIYRSHWRDDPAFDLTNTQSALPHLPCPDMDFDLLMRVARWAVENNFFAAKFVKTPMPIDAQQLLEPWMNGSNTHSDQNSIEPVDLQITGGGGGQWRLLLRNGDLIGAEQGISGNGSPGYYLNSDTLAALAQNRSTIEQSILSGRLVIEAPRAEQPRLIGILKTIMALNTKA